MVCGSNDRLGALAETAYLCFKSFNQIMPGWNWATKSLPPPRQYVLLQNMVRLNGEQILITRGNVHAQRIIIMPTLMSPMLLLGLKSVSVQHLPQFHICSWKEVSFSSLFRNHLIGDGSVRAAMLFATWGNRSFMSQRSSGDETKDHADITSAIRLYLKCPNHCRLYQNRTILLRNLLFLVPAPPSLDVPK